jgi:hypothetical protein
MFIIICSYVLTSYPLLLFIIIYLVTLTQYEKIDKDMVMLSISTCSDAHYSLSLASLSSGKNINNIPGLLPVKMLHRYYLCACGCHIYFKGAFAYFSTSTFGVMLGMTT